MKKKALIFGITGQDGAYLLNFLLKKNYIVHGVRRRISNINSKRIDNIYLDKKYRDKLFFLHYGDITDSLSVLNIIKKVKPNEVYNLAAQSHVAVSFLLPESTSNITALGALRILEAIRTLKLKKTRYYQAGSSEMFGKVFQVPQNEKTPFYPRSPYAVSKLFAHWITINYREAYNLHANNGILFNHESPFRGETFVTRKIVQAMCKIKLGLQDRLLIGNLYSKRDWGHAQDYVEAQWKILQQKKPGDYVIATGIQYTVKQFINQVATELGINLFWRGKGLNEKAYINQNKCIIQVDKKYLRPTEVDSLIGDYSKAKKILYWKPKISFKELVREMVEKDMEELRSNEKLINN
jgi:GDPmannose 4,6-dehydratase